MLKSHVSVRSASCWIARELYLDLFVISVKLVNWELHSMFGGVTLRVGVHGLNLDHLELFLAHSFGKPFVVPQVSFAYILRA